MAVGGFFLLDGVTLKYWDQGGSAKFGLVSNLENTRIDTTYKVDEQWDLRRNILSNLRGTVQYFSVGFGGKGYLKRRLPHQSLEASWLYCTNAGYRGQIARDNVTEPTLPGAEDTIIDATYEGVPYNFAEDAAMARTLDGVAWPVDESWFVGGEFKRYVSMASPKDKTRVEWGKAGHWKWVDTGRTATTGKPVIWKNVELVFTWHQVPVANIPWDSIRAQQGKCNEFRFASHPPETLVFDSPSFTGHRDLSGKRICDINYTFTLHPNGANFFPDPYRGFRFFELVSRDVSATKPYPVANFRNLFRPEDPVSD